jgi:hypothetical protein
MGGAALPPIVWDGATGFTRAGAPVSQTINVVFKDGPVLKLNAPSPAEVDKAKPAVLPTVGGTAIVEPQPVVLPPAQARLAS